MVHQVTSADPVSHSSGSLESAGPARQRKQNIQAADTYLEHLSLSATADPDPQLREGGGGGGALLKA